jgi:hypothetical protein
LKAHKAGMKKLDSLGHDPGDQLQAMNPAREYGRTLYTGVFYRDPNTEPTYEAQALERQRSAASTARPKAEILDMFVPH